MKRLTIKIGWFSGNDNIHLLTTYGDYEIRFDLADFEGESRYAVYTTFKVSGEDDKYRLTVNGYSGNAGKLWIICYWWFDFYMLIYLSLTCL